MKYLSSTIFFVHNFTLKITSARALIKARLNKGPAVSKVKKNKGLGYKTSKYGILIKTSIWIVLSNKSSDTVSCDVTNARTSSIF